MIWKALSDPTRRSILNLLKSAPRTTGELSEQFKDLSRFAIMKHLGVLEKADLITIKREGKFRWNHFNPSPIQKTYDEWVRNLTQLSLYTTATPQKMSKSKDAIYSTKVVVKTTFKVSRKKLWLCLHRDTNKWWLPECRNHQLTKKVILEMKLGGLLYEDFGRKKGFVWATITGIHDGHSLEWKGTLPPKLGGPALSFVSISLQSKDKQQTLLQVTEIIHGLASDNLQKSVKKHWQTLINKGLKPLLQS